MYVELSLYTLNWRTGRHAKWLGEHAEEHIVCWRLHSQQQHQNCDATTCCVQQDQTVSQRMCTRQCRAAVGSLLTSQVSRCSKIRPSSFSRKVVSPQYGLISALNQGLILPS